MAFRRVLGFAHSPEIRAARAFFGGADSVAPVVAVRKTSAGEADHRGFNLAHVFDQTFAEPIGVCYGGFLADPDAVVEHATEIFDEVTVNVGRDRAERLVE